MRSLVLKKIDSISSTIIHQKVAAGKKLATDFVQKCSKDFALT